MLIGVFTACVHSFVTLLRSYLVRWSNATDFIRVILLYIMLHVYIFFAPKWLQNCNTPGSYVQDSSSKRNPKVWYFAWGPSCIFLQSLLSNSRAISQVSTRQLPFALFPIHSSPIVISFYALFSEPVTEKNVNRIIKKLYFNLRNKVFNSPYTFLQNYATFKTG